MTCRVREATTAASPTEASGALVRVRPTSPTRRRQRLVGAGRPLLRLGGRWAAAATSSGRRALGTLVQNDCGVVEQALRFAADGIFRAAVVAAAVLLLASLLERPVQERREPVADRYPRSGRAPGKAHGGPRKRQARLAGLRRLNPGCIAFHRPAPPSAPVVGVSGPPGSRARSTPNKELTMPVSVFLAVPLAPRPAA
jgi:hypothetical protein